jgi:patatin-like phospholipase/acyl hydrolase
MKTYGELESRMEPKTERLKQQGHVNLSRCPLHSPNKTGVEITESRTIVLKPDYAGVRILCLDGGGIRGIVELEVLRQIEKYLGGRLSIQSFFDLIVGTSTGGIIAAGLGIEDWRVDQCIRHFMELADKAFTRRRFGIHDLPVLGKAGRKYRTKPFESVLQDLFGVEEYMFGGFQADQKRYKTRVALTSTTATGSTAVVLANYNRPEDSPFTEFIRPDRPEQELKIWEAIRASTAAPGFFKPFIKTETGQRFVDGAVYHNNPAYVAFEESRLLWPDVSHCLPDIVLSIGTGHNRLQTNRMIGGNRDSGPVRPPEVFRVGKVNGEDPQLLNRQGSEMMQNVKMILARMSNVLNSQLIWDTFKRERTITVPRHEIESVKDRFQRIDPYLGFEPPRLDDKSKMKMLREAVTKRLETDPYYQKKIRHVARRLVASSFYFEKLRHDSLGAGHYEFAGRSTSFFLLQPI